MCQKVLPVETSQSAAICYFADSVPVTASHGSS